MLTALLYLPACLPGEWGIVSTPKGMRRASWSQWGNLRHSTNVAFFVLLYAKELPKGTPVGGRAALRCFYHWHGHRLRGSSIGDADVCCADWESSLACSCVPARLPPPPPPFSQLPQRLIHTLVADAATRLPSLLPLQFRAACVKLAKSQVDYALGSAGRSFVVGWGTKPPLRVHHRAASCPDRPAPCNWDAFRNPGPNPQVRLVASKHGLAVMQ